MKCVLLATRTVLQCLLYWAFLHLASFLAICQYVNSLVSSSICIFFSKYCHVVKLPLLLYFIAVTLSVHVHVHARNAKNVIILDSFKENNLVWKASTVNLKLHKNYIYNMSQHPSAVRGFKM